MEILETVLIMLTGAVTWELAGFLYRTFMSSVNERAEYRKLMDGPDALEALDKMLEDARIKNQLEAEKHFKELDERNRKEKEEADMPGTFQCYYEGDKVIRVKGGFEFKGEQGKVCKYSTTKEKYVQVQWTNNQTWVSKNCIKLC